MKRVEHFAAALLALCLCAALLPGEAAGENAAWGSEYSDGDKLSNLYGEELTGSCGSGLTWTLDSGGTLTISGAGEMTDYSWSGAGDNERYDGDGYYAAGGYSQAPWSYYADEIVRVIVEDGATSIGDAAFAGCSGLTDLSIPDTLTKIGGYAFYGCEELEEIPIPAAVTEIGEYAFSGCEKLKTAVLPPDIIDIQMYTFRGCSALTTVTFPTSLSNILAGAFRFCASLTDVYYNGTQEQWRSVNILNNNDAITSAQIHFINDFTLPEATKYIPYSAVLPDACSVVENTLPSWLGVSGNTLSGVPLEAGTYQISIRSGSNTFRKTVTVLENGDSNVRDSVPEGYEIVTPVLDLPAYREQTWVIDDAGSTPADNKNFERFQDVYLDGRKLRGGKLSSGSTIPADWEYYAEPGSTKITILEETMENAGNGTHTISATFASDDGKSVEAVSQNYTAYAWDPSKELDYFFTDAARTRYRAAVKSLANSEKVLGFEDKTFRPGEGLTRAQSSAILARLLEAGDYSGSAGFSDAAGHWAEGSIAYCVSKGILNGTGGGRFEPENPLTGYAWAKMLFASLGYDMGAGEGWEQAVMERVHALAIDQDMSNWDPARAITREEACQMAYNAFVLQRIPKA
ncbi:MAG: leucine-rich repeat protein [Oscillospiraceae bacterium]|nr:leucine-rich repeat protein [Oscillospiraceae bacterium]